MDTAGGILLERLLKDFPQERLFVIERNAEGKGRHWPSVSLKVPLGRFEFSRFHRWKRSLHGIGLIPDVHPDKIDALLAGFRPQIVLCIMASGAYYGAAWNYARARGLPLIVIVHDVNDQFEPVLAFARDAVRRRDAAAYRYATLRLCISSEMEALCADRYGVRGVVMHPNRSEELLARPLVESARLKSAGRLTVGFAGNLNYGYGEELLRLLPALRASCSRLLIFGHPPGASSAALLDARDCVEFRGYTPTPADAWHAI